MPEQAEYAMSKLVKNEGVRTCPNYIPTSTERDPKHSC